VRSFLALLGFTRLCWYQRTNADAAGEWNATDEELTQRVLQLLHALRLSDCCSCCMLFVCQKTVAAVAMLLICQTVAAVACSSSVRRQPRSSRGACALDPLSLLALLSLTSTNAQILTSEELSGEQHATAATQLY
jgi:hypothetical protein